MKITNILNHEITSPASWKEAFCEVDTPGHWKEGRSACCLARYISGQGIPAGEKKLAALIGACIGNDIPVAIESGRIEHESRFDRFRGKGRMHDLAVWGRAGRRPFSVCIEAKVDETFNDTIGESYAKARARLEKYPRSKGAERIEGLVRRFFPDGSGPGEGNVAYLRYQLLYYLAGSLAEAKDGTNLVFMPVLVFRTAGFDPAKGDANRQDYLNFVRALGFERVECGDILCFRKEIEGRDVYTMYHEIIE